MILIDSNLIIYSAINKNDNFLSSLRYEDCCFSIISQVEVMGFKGLKKEDENYFKLTFKTYKKPSRYRPNHLQSHRTPPKKKIRTR